jgi:hypothetical protein
MGTILAANFSFNEGIKKPPIYVKNLPRYSLAMEIYHPQRGRVNGKSGADKAQGMGFVSPLVSPARKLAPHPPSLFSPFSLETVPAQSSTDFLTHTLRLICWVGDRKKGFCSRHDLIFLGGYTRIEARKRRSFGCEFNEGEDTWEL